MLAVLKKHGSLLCRDTNVSCWLPVSICLTLAFPHLRTTNERVQNTVSTFWPDYIAPDTALRWFFARPRGWFPMQGTTRKKYILVSKSEGNPYKHPAFYRPTSWGLKLLRHLNSALGFCIASVQLVMGVCRLALRPELAATGGDSIFFMVEQRQNTPISRKKVHIFKICNHTFYYSDHLHNSFVCIKVSTAFSCQ